MSSKSPLRPQNYHQEFSELMTCFPEGSALALAWGQKSQLPSSVYTSQRKGAQLSLGSESSSLMRPLKTAPWPIIVLLTECELPSGTSWENTCSFFLCLQFQDTFLSVHPSVFYCSEISIAIIILFSLKIFFVTLNMGGIRGKFMCFIHQCVVCVWITQFEEQIQCLTQLILWGNMESYQLTQYSPWSPYLVSMFYPVHACFKKSNVEQYVRNYSYKGWK